MFSTSMLAPIDWAIIISFFAISLIIGIAVSKNAGKSAASFFLGGRNMPWWLLGVSMVATTFSSDTPNLVADLTRGNGISGNWVWWSQLLAGMATVFIYSKLWRRTNALTDVEFYEIRYSGKSAAFLRGFRAIYLGAFYNIVIMATVTLAIIKIGSVMFGFSPVQTVLVAAIVTTVYSMLGGLKGILITDFFMFGIAMGGSIISAIYAVNMTEVGGLTNLLAHSSVSGKLNLVPNFATTDIKVLLTIFILPLTIFWWAAYYPGAEPGGGGYLAQRMFAAKDEKGAVKATLFFVVANYALRPWPWIMVALCSLIVFPDLASLQEAFPHISENVIGNDLAYSAMLVRALPAGILGLVATSLVAAYMSTMSTSLNWGSSYIVNDYYKRFVNVNATDKQQVYVGRISTVLLMTCACILALFLSTAVDGFFLLLQIGAGTGLIFILRWFWWRVNAFSELTGMVASFIVSLFFFIYNKIILASTAAQTLIVDGMTPDAALKKCGGFDVVETTLLIIAITTLAWIIATYLTPPTSDSVLRNFYSKIHPSRLGWRPVLRKAKDEGVYIEETTKKHNNLPMGILCTVVGCITVYSTLFATGYYIYGSYYLAIPLTLIAVCGAVFIAKSWKQIISAPPSQENT